MSTTAWPQKIRDIRLLLLDVDGVLTDGRIIYSDERSETKAFNVKDGMGLKMVMKAGIEVGLVTGRKSSALTRRCRDLGLNRIYDGVRQKAPLLEKIVADTGIDPERTAFVGDDLPDLPLMKKVGLSIAVADAHEAVRECADWVTKATGGHGAVREVCDAMLKAQGHWDRILEGF